MASFVGVLFAGQRQYSLRTAVCARADSDEAEVEGRSLTRRNLLGLLGLAAAAPVVGVTAREVGLIPASGMIFKDYLNVIEFEDPKVSGVKLYVSDFQRPLSEKLQKNFFSDPSQASVTCVRAGPIHVSKDISESREGEEVFSQTRNAFFKSVHVRRLYDKDANVLIYISYATRFAKNDDDNKSRFKSSMCAVPIDPSTPATVPPK
eukprot:Plantae.Rhodophyta-Purpureofilum_apyrenoidigerum.ctg13519.p1 GENE.Plantae.Rhodophyta-Purpureofilum_apyrenoidigerum.ctg13519~~Plantae.Rhodophyta-Purpureofilum_apyrenoidigerum.ctg13519.p1  ORF type:complete len:206 (-),score=28.96 Plantae.Rhodophyta-Purpureofilum_apyrenoidigerum.ctg13519:288-905(-)